jgi:hypothetical protein
MLACKEMGNEVVVSIGRVLADQVCVDPSEAFAVVDQLWRRIGATRDENGAMVPFPSLNAIGITPMGDFEVRKAAAQHGRTSYAPHLVAHDLGGLLLRLLTSGHPAMDAARVACLDAARRASARGPQPAGVHALLTPDALLTAIEACRPRDGSLALASLYARWLRTTDRAHAGPWEAMVAAHPVLADPNTDRPIQHEPPTSTGPRRSVPGLAALALLALCGVAGWWGVRVSPLGGIAGRDAAVVATSSDSRIAERPQPTAPGHVPADDALPRRRPGGVVVPVKARRLLDAGTTGRAPYSPSFDPRTKALVFHTGIEHTALLQASVGSDGALGSISTMREDGSRNYHAQVSPDGQHLAYDSDSLGTRAVYIANRDGSSPRRVSGAGYASVPTWSPDGQYVAFARAEPHRPRVWNVWTVHVPTGELRRLTSHRVGQPWGASWFPDGQRIAYSVEDRLIVRDVASGAARAYATPLPGRLVRTPAVAPDGQRIVFQVYRDGAWVLDLRTGESRRLLADAHAEEFAWSPDGRCVAYHSSRGGERGIWILDMELAP